MEINLSMMQLKIGQEQFYFFLFSIVKNKIFYFLSLLNNINLELK
jgi:hypothetical protein